MEYLSEIKRRDLLEINILSGIQSDIDYMEYGLGINYLGDLINELWEPYSKHISKNGLPLRSRVMISSRVSMKKVIDFNFYIIKECISDVYIKVLEETRRRGMKLVMWNFPPAGIDDLYSIVEIKGDKMREHAVMFSYIPYITESLGMAEKITVIVSSNIPFWLKNKKR